MNLRGRNRLRERKWNSIRWTAACQKPLHATGNYNTGRQGAKALRGLSLRRRGRGLAGRGRNPSVIRVRRLDARLGGITTRSWAVIRPYGTLPDQDRFHQWTPGLAGTSTYYYYTLPTYLVASTDYPTISSVRTSSPVNHDAACQSPSSDWNVGLNLASLGSRARQPRNGHALRKQTPSQSPSPAERLASSLRRPSFPGCCSVLRV